MTSWWTFIRSAAWRPCFGHATAVGFLALPAVWSGCSPAEPTAATSRENASAVFDKSEFSPKEWAIMREMDREEMLEYKRKLREDRKSAGKPRS